MYPEDDIGPAKNPDLFRFFTRYQIRFGLGFGLLDSRKEAKRLQDRAFSFFKQFYIKKFTDLVLSGLSVSDASISILDQAKMWMMPWQLKRLAQLIGNASNGVGKL